MAQIKFRARIKPMIYGIDEDHADYDYIPVPKLTRNHCDMAAFRCHPKYRVYANSDLFPAMLAHIRRDHFGKTDAIRLDSPLPRGVSVDTSGFLAEVTIEV